MIAVWLLAIALLVAAVHILILTYRISVLRRRCLLQVDLIIAIAGEINYAYQQAEVSRPRGRWSRVVRWASHRWLG